MQPVTVRGYHCLFAACCLLLLPADSAGVEGKAVQLDFKRFEEEVVGADNVWLVVFGFTGDGEELQKGLQVSEATGGWLRVGWMDVRDPLSRLVADVHGASSYPAARVFSGASFDQPIPVSASQITEKNAVETWLPSRYPNPSGEGNLVRVLPAAEEWDAEESGKRTGNPLCTVSLPREKETDPVALASLRAAVLKMWRTGPTTALKPAVSEAYTVSCGEGPSEFPSLEETVSKLRTFSGNPKPLAPSSQIVEARRQKASEDAFKAALTLVNRAATWKTMLASPASGLFILDSTDAGFRENLEIGGAVARGGGGKAAKSIPFSFFYVDSAVEKQALLSALHVRSNKPMFLIVIQVQMQTPEGETVPTKAVMHYTGKFEAAAIQKFIDNEVLKGQNLMPIEFESIPETLSGDDDTDDEVEGVAPDAEADPLIFSASEGQKKAAEKKKQTAKKQKEKKKKKKSKKETQKEKEKREKVIEEVRKKKEERERRIREKQEKEAAEKEENQRLKEEKKKAKKVKKKGEAKEENGKTKKEKKEKEKAKKEKEKKKKEKEKKKREKEKEKEKKKKERERKEKEKKKKEEPKKKKERGEDSENLSQEERIRQLYREMEEKAKKEREQKNKEEKSGEEL